MGVWEYPCPGCGQAQKVRAPNGSEIKLGLCAACAESEGLRKARVEAGFEGTKARDDPPAKKAGRA